MEGLGTEVEGVEMEVEELSTGVEVVETEVVEGAGSVITVEQSTSTLMTVPREPSSHQRLWRRHLQLASPYQVVQTTTHSPSAGAALVLSEESRFSWKTAWPSP